MGKGPNIFKTLLTFITVENRETQLFSSLEMVRHDVLAVAPVSDADECLGFDGRAELTGALVSCALSPQVPLESGPDVTPRGGPGGPALLGRG